MKLITILFLLTIATSGYAQPKRVNYGFMPAVIHPKKGDSIVCLIEKQIVYGRTVLYKLTDQGSPKEIPSWEINYFKAAGKTFECVVLNNQYQLMELVEAGKLRLYQFSEIKYAAPKSNGKGERTTSGDIITRYVIRQAGIATEVTDSSYLPVLKQIFSDCLRMQVRITRRYVFEDMPAIIQDYNTCKGEQCEHTAKAVKND